jgi:F0F1-type ATP synthase membrane subunit b/b'
VKFDASFFVVVVIFGIAYFLLKLVLFDPLLRILQRRERRVEEARTAWQAATATAEESLAEERRRLLAARREARAQTPPRPPLLVAPGGPPREPRGRARAELAADVQRESQALAARVESLAARIGERLVGRAV